MKNNAFVNGYLEGYMSKQAGRGVQQAQETFGPMANKAVGAVKNLGREGMQHVQGAIGSTAEAVGNTLGNVGDKGQAVMNQMSQNVKQTGQEALGLAKDVGQAGMGVARNVGTQVAQGYNKATDAVASGMNNAYQAAAPVAQKVAGGVKSAVNAAGNYLSSDPTAGMTGQQNATTGIKDPAYQKELAAMQARRKQSQLAKIRQTAPGQVASR